MANRPWYSVYASEYKREFDMAIKLSGLTTSEVFRRAMLRWIAAQPGLRGQINQKLKITPDAWKQIQKRRDAVAKAKVL